MGKASRTKTDTSRRQKIAAQREAARRAERRRKLTFIGAIVAAAAVIIGGVTWYAVGRGGSKASAEVMPPGVGGGTPLVQAAAHQVPNTSGISGVVAYVTTGW